MMSWFLKRVKPDVTHREEKHPLAAQKVDIGTADGNEVLVKCSNQRVGKYHAVITFRGNCPYVRDQGSRNGTFLNKQRQPIKTHKEHKLASGDIISFGCMSKCHDGKGCFCYRIEKVESCQSDTKEIAQVQKRSESKPQLSKRNEDTRANKICQNNVNFRKEKPQLMLRNIVEKQKIFVENNYSSDDEWSHCHSGKEPAQVRHNVEKQWRQHCDRSASQFGEISEKNKDTSTNEGSPYRLDLVKEIAQIRGLRHNFMKNLKSPEGRENDMRADKRGPSYKEMAQVRHNVEKQKRLENNEDTRATEGGSYRIDVTKEIAQVRNSRHDLMEKPKRPEERDARADRKGPNCKETPHLEKQKHSAENDESPVSERGQYHIDLTKEITQARRNLVNIQTRAEENEDMRRKEMEDVLASEKLQQELMAKIMPGETIPREPPGREFIKEGSSFCYFNADSLEKPPTIKCANIKDSVRFSQYLRKCLQDMLEDNMSSEYCFDTDEKETVDKNSREVLKYILMLTSVHQDEFIVECGSDLLLKLNNQWEITQRSFRNILLNWGADINQIMPTSRYPPPMLKNNAETVSEENVNAVLRILSAQLKVQKKAHESKCSGKWDEFLFGVLVLLSLDNKFIGCYSEVLNCLCALLDNIQEKSESDWVLEYSKKLLELEDDHYNLTSIVCYLLNGSLAAERLRVSASFAAIQRIVGAPMDKINFQFEWRGCELYRLVKNTTLLATLKPVDIYCLLIFMDIILRHPKILDEPTGKFHKWLERLDPKIGINPHLNALVSNYRVLWDVETQESTT